MDGEWNFTNNRSILVSEWQNLDSLNSLWVTYVFEIVSFICIFYSIIALLALQRTKATPKTSRFLSSALISYDILAVFCFNTRRFIENHEWNIMVQVVGVSFTNLAFVTIGLMSFERLIVFHSPYFYLRYVQVFHVKTATITFWIVYISIYWLLRVVACAMVYPPFSYYNVIGVCNKINFIYYGVAIIFVSVCIVLCYVKIFMIIRKEHVQIRTTGNIYGKSTSLKYLRNYRSTSLVFVYSLTSLASTVMYAVLISLKLDQVSLRLGNDAINTFCCMMDPVVYVLWYRECRMEILKLFSCCIPSLKHRAEKMRCDIFDISGSSNLSNTNLEVLPNKIER